MPRTLHELNNALPYLFPREIDELTRLAQDLPPNPRVLNIGAGNGVSAATFLASRPDLYLMTVDIQQASSPFGCLEGEKITLEELGLYDLDRFQQVHANSQELALYFVGDPFQFIFVDGDHSLEGATRDIVRWWEHLALGGMMGIHDYRKADLPYGFATGCPHPMPWPGVNEAVETNLLGKHLLVSHIDSLIVFQKDEA